MPYNDINHWCPGPCTAGARKRVAEHQRNLLAYRNRLELWQATPAGERGPEPVAPEEPKVTPVYGDPYYCPACTWDVKAKLSRLDGMAAVAAREADGMRGATREAKVRSSREHGSPSPTVEDLDELDAWLRDTMAGYLGADSIARQGTLMDSITLGVSWLVARAERILARPVLADPFAAKVQEWYGKLRAFDPSDVTVERIPIRCPGCHRMTLERRAGDDTVRCRTAGCVRGESISWEQVRGMVEDALAARAS